MFHLCRKLPLEEEEFINILPAAFETVTGVFFKILLACFLPPALFFSGSAVQYIGK